MPLFFVKFSAIFYKEKFPPKEITAKDTPKIEVIIVIIQYLKTICVSDQPFASKWWCNGATLKILRLNNLTEITCITVVKRVINRTKAIIGKSKTVSVINAIITKENESAL